MRGQTVFSFVKPTYLSSGGYECLIDITLDSTTKSAVHLFMNRLDVLKPQLYTIHQVRWQTQKFGIILAKQRMIASDMERTRKKSDFGIRFISEFGMGLNPDSVTVLFQENQWQNKNQPGVRSS